MNTQEVTNREIILRELIYEEGFNKSASVTGLKHSDIEGFAECRKRWNFIKILIAAKKMNVSDYI